MTRRAERREDDARPGLHGVGGALQGLLLDRARRGARPIRTAGTGSPAPRRCPAGPGPGSTRAAMPATTRVQPTTSRTTRLPCLATAAVLPGLMSSPALHPAAQLQDPQRPGDRRDRDAPGRRDEQRGGQRRRALPPQEGDLDLLGVLEDQHHEQDQHARRGRWSRARACSSSSAAAGRRARRTAGCACGLAPRGRLVAAALRAVRRGLLPDGRLRLGATRAQPRRRSAHPGGRIPGRTAVCRTRGSGRSAGRRAARRRHHRGDPAAASARTATPCWTCTRTSPRTPCGCGSSPPAGTPGRTYVAHLFDEPTPTRPRWSRWSAGGSPGLATAEVLDRRPRRGGVPGLRRGPRPRAGQPAAGAPRRAGSRARRDPLRRRGAGRQQRDAAGVPGRRLRRLPPHRDGEVSVELRTDVSAAALDAADRREWRSEARSLRPLLAPASVAVVGVRRDDSGVGAAVLEAIKAGGYAGRLCVVHPERGTVPGWGVLLHRRRARARRPRGGRGPGRPGGRRDGGRLRGGAGAAVIVSSGFAGRGPVGRPRPARAGAGAQRAAWSALTRRACSAGPRPARSTRRSPGPASRGRPRGRHAVGRRRVHRARPGARAGCGRALVRLAGRQARRVQQRPAGRVGRRRGGDRGGAVPRVVRQRVEVRADGATVRRAQAAARGRRRRYAAERGRAPCSRRPA